MNTAEKTIIPQWVTGNFDALEKVINGHKSKPIHKIRKQAIELFKKTGMPSPSDEEWKYTNISEISSNNFKLSQRPTELKQDQISSYFAGGAENPRVVFVDGKFSAELSNAFAEENKIAGLKISQFSSVLEDPAAFKEFYSSINLKDENFETEQAIVALNTSFAAEGLGINIAPQTAIPGFLHLMFVTSSAQSDVFSPIRIMLSAAKGSSVSILESHIGLGTQNYFSAPVTEISAAENSEVNYFKIGLESENAYHLGNIMLRQERDSRTNLMFFTTGGKLVRNEVRVKIDGSNANASINGLTVLDNLQHVDNHTVIDHALPHSESREKIKGIYAGKSKGVFNGTIIVRKDAQKTNAYQSNQTVLLSKDASIDSKPQLKIWADDVKCTHGATVGQLDEDALFYLRSRGLDKNTARNLLVHAFASEVLTEIKEEKIKAYLEIRLGEKLDGIGAQ
jgi:Fe-S cluster assembly protein SufD